MQFSFGEDPLLLQSTLRDFLDAEHGPDRVRELWASETGRDAALWKQLAELGLAGLLVPETHEGMGLDETSLVLLMEEAGRAALAEPVVSTAAVGAPLLAELAEAGVDSAAEWLKRVAVGEAIVAVGHPVSPFVSDAHVADLLLLANGDAEIHAVARDDASLSRETANDPARRLYSVSFSPSEATRVAEGETARALLGAALDRGALACAAQQLGVADRLVELAVAYASQREQFGKPIGSFQAVKHMLANVKVALEYARPVVYRAAHSVAHGDPQRAVHASMAKVAASDAAGDAARIALQVHGAIGYTWEQDLHIWMRRAWSLGHFFGESVFHRERVAGAVLADGASIGPGTTF